VTGPLRARDPKHRKASTNGRAPRGPAVRTFLAPLGLLASWSHTHTPDALHQA